MSKQDRVNRRHQGSAALIVIGIAGTLGAIYMVANDRYAMSLQKKYYAQEATGIADRSGNAAAEELNTLLQTGVIREIPLRNGTVSWESSRYVTVPFWSFAPVPPLPFNPFTSPLNSNPTFTHQVCNPRSFNRILNTLYSAVPTPVTPAACATPATQVTSGLTFVKTTNDFVNQRFVAEVRGGTVLATTPTGTDLQGFNTHFNVVLPPPLPYCWISGPVPNPAIIGQKINFNLITSASATALSVVSVVPASIPIVTAPTLLGGPFSITAVDPPGVGAYANTITLQVKDSLGRTSTCTGTGYVNPPPSCSFNGANPFNPVVDYNQAFYYGFINSFATAATIGGYGTVGPYAIPGTTTEYFYYPNFNPYSAFYFPLSGSASAGGMTNTCSGTVTVLPCHDYSFVDNRGCTNRLVIAHCDGSATVCCQGYACFIRPAGGSCFDPDTDVLMANGATRKAGEIQVGDMVWNPVTGKSMRVQALVKGPEPIPMRELGFGGSLIHVTTTHPMLTLDGLKPAAKVTRNDFLMGADGKFHAVDVSRELAVKKGQTVRNFKFNFYESRTPENHFLVANGIVTGDYVLQNLLYERPFELSYFRLDQLGKNLPAKLWSSVEEKGPRRSWRASFWWPDGGGPWANTD